MILAVETSCDDTCAAVVSERGEIRSNRVASQGLLHARYGGVVPEVASRRHLEVIDAVAADALESAGTTIDDIESVAVTRGPGLIGALLVGVSWAKATAAARGLPLVAVDHLHGHVVAATLEPDPVETPYLALVASGGHTFIARVEDPRAYEILGQTLDDAAGEAFDKGARLLGLGYPGGPELDRLAREGDPDAFDFPRSAPRGRPRLQLQRAEDRVALQGARAGGGRDGAPPGGPGGRLPGRDRGVAHHARGAGHRARAAWPT